MNKEDYGKYYIQGSDHYLIPKDVFDELFDEMESWKGETKMYYLEIKNISKNYTRIISFETEYQRKRYLDKIKYVNEIVVLDYGRLVSEK